MTVKWGDSIKIITGIGTFYNVNISSGNNSIMFGFNDKDTLLKIKQVDKNLDSLKHSELVIHGKTESECFYFTATSKTYPGVVDRNLNSFKMEDVKDGMYGRLSVVLTSRDDKWEYHLNSIQVMEKSKNE